MSFAYLPLYTGDYLRDTADLTVSEHGIYLLLLMYCWDSRGPVPPDEARAARIVGASSDDERNMVKFILSTYFVRHADGWYNERMDREIARCNAISGARSEAGKLGGINTWNRRQANAQANAKQLLRHAPLSPSPSPSLASTPSQGQPRTSKPSKVKTTVSGQKPPATREAKTGSTWSAYSTEYETRYQVKPPRNATVNAHLSAFLARVGSENAPGIAAHYVRSNRGLYVSAKHATALLLRDAEALSTEWLTRTHGTDTQARQTDKTQALGNVFQELIDEGKKHG